MNRDDTFYSSGDPEIDQVRREVAGTPTDAQTFRVRAFLLKLWICALQQQGAHTAPYLPVDEAFGRLFLWNLLIRDGQPQEFTREQMDQMGEAVDEGYRIAEEIQRRLCEEGPVLPALMASEPIPAAPTPAPIDWPLYHGNPHHSGYSPLPGPIHGRAAWKLPVGLGWEARPAVEGDRVYVASPGMRSICYCLDLDSGEEIWATRQITEIVGDQLYSTACLASTPVVLRDEIVLREMGSRGNQGRSRHLVFVDKRTGEIGRKVEAGHVDYRTGYAPVAADEEFAVFPHGVHDIEATPPVAQCFNRVVCRETRTGNLCWDFNLGHIFAEPLMDGGHVLVGTLNGYVYCLKLRGRFPPPSAQRIEWEFQADGPVNRRVEAADGRVFFGSNGGSIYCLDRSTGRLVWRHQAQPVETRAFRHFSTPCLAAGRLFVSAANRRLYCLDADTGALRWEYLLPDWGRARPVAHDGRVYVVSMDGTLHCLDVDGESLHLLWREKVSAHPIYADLTLARDRLLIAGSDLHLSCVDLNGRSLWRKSLIRCFERDGHRIFTEQIAGGAYYQSKPTAADGKVFFGTPSHFLHAVEADTGREIWRFEMGAAISAGPAYADGRVYAGQQGGEEYFYCVDAEDGSPIWKQSLGWVWGSANVAGGRVYVPGIDGYVNCLNAEDGSIRWRHRTARSTCTEPAIDADTVYFGGWDHFLYAFDMESGDLRWQFQLSGGADSGAPIAYEGKVYLPVGGNSFRCLNGRTGELIWQFQREACIYNVTPAYHQGRVFISVHHGRGLGGIPVAATVYCLDAASGAVLWKHDGGGLTGPVVAGDRVYFGSTTKPFLYCVDAAGNGDGTTTCRWVYRFGNKVEESTPGVYAGRIYILASDGYLHAIE